MHYETTTVVADIIATIVPLLGIVLVYRANANQYPKTSKS